MNLLEEAKDKQDFDIKFVEMIGFEVKPMLPLLATSREVSKNEENVLLYNPFKEVEKGEREESEEVLRILGPHDT